MVRKTQVKMIKSAKLWFSIFDLNKVQVYEFLVIILNKN